mmetsp:Transcript_37823/g.118519  ORF Transcript_37823/g.118519 Transcript_37823/m.118519 type:complete len:358 (-) Transcript_37823:1543-2616(-)
MGQIRCEALASHNAAQLAWIVDGRADICGTHADRYGARATPDIAEALADPTLDAIWISAPTDAHESLIKDAFAAGKAVGVEKPVCKSPRAAAKCYDAAEAAGLPLFCSFQRRFDAAYNQVAEQVAAGAIGEVKKVHTVFRDHPCPPIEFLKTGGDPFNDLLVHDLDYVLSDILQVRSYDEMPTRVMATGTSFIPELQAAGVMETASILIEFPSGVVVTMEADRFASYGYDQRCEVFGTEGMAQVNNPSRSAFTLANNGGYQTDVLQHSFPERFAEAYGVEIDAFLRVVAKEQEPRVTRDDVNFSAAVAEAGRLSAVNGCVVTPRLNTATDEFEFFTANGEQLAAVEEAEPMAGAVAV